MNHIRLEQSREEVSLAFEVHKNASITDVRLSKSRLTSHQLEESREGPIVVKFVIRSRSADAPKGILRVEVDFRMVGEVEASRAKGPASSKPLPVMTVESTYVVDYELREGFEPSAQHVKAFREGNVIFNCWPYFREYLQESVQRMGFPGLTAPFLRVERKPPKNGKKPPVKQADAG